MKKNGNRKWFHPEVSDTGWDKDLPPETRRSLMLKAHGGDVTASAQALQALANVTEDPVTKEEAGKDARYLYKMIRKERAVRISQRTPRITPRVPRLR